MREHIHAGKAERKLVNMNSTHVHTSYYWGILYNTVMGTVKGEKRYGTDSSGKIISVVWRVLGISVVVWVCRLLDIMNRTVLQSIKKKKLHHKQRISLNAWQLTFRHEQCNDCWYWWKQGSFRRKLWEWLWISCKKKNNQREDEMLTHQLYVCGRKET